MSRASISSTAADDAASPPVGSAVPFVSGTGSGSAGFTSASGLGALGALGSATVGSTGTVTGTPPRKLVGRRRPEIVGVLLFSGAPIFESSIPLSVFGMERQDNGLPNYRLQVCAGEDGPLATTGGLTMTAPHGLEGLARAGTVVVPAWRSAAQTPPAEALAALRKAHAEGARIIGLCTGAFVLAAAGLLDGRPATTHWMYAPTLAKRYPHVQVDPRELFIDDGDVLTSAGTAAGIDLCLHVVRTDHGVEAATTLARRLVVPTRRPGGQAPYIDRSLPEEIGNDPLAEVVTWALDNLSKQFDVEALAARAYMSRRTFDRRFRSLTGSAPLQWLISQRVLQAQRLLETTDVSVDEVARRCGFRSPVALRGHFRRQLGVSPAVYRSNFRARRVETAAAHGHGTAGVGSGGAANPSPSAPAGTFGGSSAGPRDTADHAAPGTGPYEAGAAHGAPYPPGYPSSSGIGAGTAPGVGAGAAAASRRGPTATGAAAEPTSGFLAAVPQQGRAGASAASVASPASPAPQHRSPARPYRAPRPGSVDHAATEDGRPGPMQALGHPEGTPTARQERAPERS